MTKPMSLAPTLKDTSTHFWPGANAALRAPLASFRPLRKTKSRTVGPQT